MNATAEGPRGPRRGGDTAWRHFEAKARALGASVHHVAREDDAAGFVLAAASDAVATGGLVRRFPTLARHLAAPVDPLAPDRTASGSPLLQALDHSGPIDPLALGRTSSESPSPPTREVPAPVEPLAPGHPSPEESLPTRVGNVAAPIDPTAARQAATAEVVGMAALAVAETGSVLVVGSNADRAASLLAERLWLVVAADDLVATLDEALSRVGELIGKGDNPYVTFMSGPSRTADIERTLTTGVHGPRAVAIVVVDGA